MKRYFADPRDARSGTQISADGLASTIDATQRTLKGKGVKTRMCGHVLIEGGDKNRPGGISRWAQFASLNTDGDTMEVYLWQGSDWAATTTTVYKPYIFRYTYWNGATIVYADGTSRTYDTTSLDKAYQRRASWTGGNAEIQEITSPYGVGETLKIVTDIDGNLMDDNNAGRHWAATA